MMNVTPEIKRFVRDEVARQLNIILSGKCEGTKDVETESIGEMYPGMPTIVDRPVMHPYGFASRAPKGTIQVTAKNGADPTNRMVLGHRDSDRPDDLEEGESAVYSTGGWNIKVRNEKVEISNKEGTQSLTMDGDNVQINMGLTGKFSFTNAQGEFLASLIQILQNSTAGGYPLLADPAGMLVLQSMQE